MSPFFRKEGEKRPPAPWETKLVEIEELYKTDEDAALQQLLELGLHIAIRNRLEALYGDSYAWIEQDRAHDCLNFTEMLTVYTSFVAANGCDNAVRVLGDVARNVVKKMDAEYEEEVLGHTTMWLLGVYFEVLRERLPLMRACEVSSDVGDSLDDMLRNHPELCESAVGLVTDMMHSSYWDEKKAALACVTSGYGTAESFYLISEYFKDPKDNDTFFADAAIEVVEWVLEKELRPLRRKGVNHSLGEEEKVALGTCLDSISKAMEVARERGHQRYILLGLISLKQKFPEIADLITNPALKAELKNVGRKRGIRQQEGLHTGRLNTFRYGRYDFLNKLFDGLTTIQQERLIGYLEEQENSDEVEILNDIFGSEETRSLTEVFFLTHGELRNVCKCLFKNRMVLELMALMAGRDEYSFEMGGLLSMMDFSDLPKNLQIKLNPALVESDQDLILKKSHWELCDDAETRMTDAMYNQAVMVVNDTLLMKFKGKLSAICLKTFTTKRGFTFVEKNWYSPVDMRTREKIKDAYYSGQDLAELIDYSEWVLMRAVTTVGDRSEDEFFREVKRIAGKIDSRVGGEYDPTDYRFVVSLEDP